MAQEINHIAIIPDGNRRWAEKRGLPALEGHRRGAEVMHTVVEHLIDRQVKYLTVWGLSTDNWKRGGEELQDLMSLLELWIRRDVPWLNSKGICLRHMGRLDRLTESLKSAVSWGIAKTKENEGMALTLAFNYSGRAEIVDAVRQLINNNVSASAISEERFSRYLYQPLPDVDLVIRTAGEFRLSNFLLWQTAYSEFFFSESLWPDFGIKELEKALQEYNNRQRRFGGN